MSLLKPSANTESRGGMSFNPAVLVLLVLFVLSSVGFVWSFMNYRTYKNKYSNIGTPAGQQEVAKQEIAALVAKVSKHIVLPKDEEPTVATVVDAAALAKDQPFYKDAHNGDKVLIYVKAQKAIIFDEKNDRLVNVGPVYIDKQANATESKTEQAKPSPVSLEVRNGSEVAGAAKEFGDRLAARVAEFTLIKTANAAKNDYSGMILVNKKGVDVSTLSNELGASVVNEVPEGEADTNADLLLIVGNE